MRHAPSNDLAGPPAGQDGPAAGDAGTLTGRAADLLAAPGLVVLAGGPGCGRSRALRHIAAAVPGPVYAGGGLSMLRDVPAFALARAVRVRLPDTDPPLLAEAVRSRVRGGLLVLDDLQFADPATLAALPLLAAHCRVLAALRTPHPLPEPAVARLRAAATGWLPVSPLDPAAAADLARATAPGLDPAALDGVVRRAGGLPLAVRALARHAATAGTPPPAAPGTLAGPASPAPDGDGGVGYAVATALTDLPRPARTALAALGLLGRPASAALLGPGVAALVEAGLATSEPADAAADGRPADGGDPERSGGDRLGAAPTDSDRLGAAPTDNGGDRLRGAASGAGGPPGETAPPRADPGAGRVPTRQPAGHLVSPVSPYVAEIAAGLLDRDARTALHRRLAALTPPREAARHLAAAGDTAAAYATATTAAAAATTAGERAELLLLACRLPGRDPDPRVRVAAATAALAAGRPRAAVAVLDGCPTGDPTAAVLRGEALLHAGDLARARAAVAALPDGADPHTLAGRDRILLLADLHTDPAGSADRAAAATARHGDPPAHPGLRAALAAVRAAGRAPGWEYALASAAATAGQAGDVLAARWSAWLLVETLAEDGRLAEAAETAGQAAQACAADLAYSWQTRFLAAQLWCTALRGAAPRPAGDPRATTGDRTAVRPGPATAGRAGPPHGDGTATSGVSLSRLHHDELVRRAGDLTDRSLPGQARGYAIAAVSLLEADGGLLAAARHRLSGASPAGPAVAAVLDWVGREAAWLDGQPDRARLPDPLPPAPPLIDGLRRITAYWAAHDDGGPPPPAAPPGQGLPDPARHTVAAWAGGAGPATDGFGRAAAAWHPVSVREEVRCLLACALHTTDGQAAVPALLAAERLAEQAGLVVLLGRTRRALRRHAVRRDVRGPRTGDDLTARERAVLSLVARGEPTRRIAGQLGISGETVETHIRAGMRKLGARTRTEAAALALEVLR